MITSYHIPQKTNLLSVSQGPNLLVLKGSSFQVSHSEISGMYTFGRKSWGTKRHYLWRLGLGTRSSSGKIRIRRAYGFI